MNRRFVSREYAATSMKQILFLVVALVLLSTGSIRVDAAPVDPRALALGGAYTTLARGSEALHWNPANLRANPTRFELTLPVSAGVGLDNSYFSLNRLILVPEDYSSGEAFLKEITGGRFDVAAGGGLHSGLHIGSLGLSLRLESAAHVALSPDATRLFTVGSQAGTTYTLSGTRVESYGVVSGGGGFAFALPALRLNRASEEALVAIGVNAKYYRGLFYAAADITGTIDVSEDSEYTADLALNALHTDVESVYGSGSMGLGDLPGQGYGVDFGVTARTGPKWTFGAVVKNAVSTMTWYDLTETEAKLEGALLSAGGDGPQFPEDLDDFTEHHERDVPSVERRLPAEVRAGVSYRHSPHVLVAADVAKGLAGQGSSEPLSFHVGTELTPFAQASFGKRFALRVGYEHSANRNFYSYGVGFALWGWEIDAGDRKSVV